MPRPDGTPYFTGLPANATSEQRMAWLRAQTPEKRAELAKLLTPANTTTLDKWISSHAGQSDTVRGRISLAVDFFRQRFTGQWKKDDAAILSELICTDFSRPVRVTPIPQGEMLVGYKTPGSRALGGTYFTRVGYGAQNLGLALTGTNGDGVEMEKEYRLYRVVKTIQVALESYCSPASDRWSLKGRRVLAFGGALQLCFPDAPDHLELVRTGRPEVSARKAARAFYKRG